MPTLHKHSILKVCSVQLLCEASVAYPTSLLLHFSNSAWGCSVTSVKRRCSRGDMVGQRLICALLSYGIEMVILERSHCDTVKEPCTPDCSFIVGLQR